MITVQKLLAFLKVVNDIPLNMNNQRVTLLNVLYVRIVFDKVTLSQLLRHSFGLRGGNLVLVLNGLVREPLSKSFKFAGGVPQACSLSPQLFTLYSSKLLD